MINLNKVKMKNKKFLIKLIKVKNLYWKSIKILLQIILVHLKINLKKLMM